MDKWKRDHYKKMTHGSFVRFAKENNDGNNRGKQYGEGL